MTHEEVISQFEKQKNKHLTQSIILDAIGMATFLIPFLGEALDIIYAPIYGIAIFAMYKVRLGKVTALLGGIGGFAEELLPGLDIIPTASLMWAYTYISRREQTLASFTKGKVKDREIIEKTIRWQQQPSLLTRIGNSIKKMFFSKPQPQNLDRSQEKYDEYLELPEGKNRPTPE